MIYTIHDLFDLYFLEAQADGLEGILLQTVRDETGSQRIEMTLNLGEHKLYRVALRIICGVEDLHDVVIGKLLLHTLHVVNAQVVHEECNPLVSHFLFDSFDEIQEVNSLDCLAIVLPDQDAMLTRDGSGHSSCLDVKVCIIDLDVLATVAELMS